MEMIDSLRERSQDQEKNIAKYQRITLQDLSSNGRQNEEDACQGKRHEKLLSCKVVVVGQLTCISCLDGNQGQKLIFSGLMLELMKNYWLKWIQSDS